MSDKTHETGTDQIIKPSAEIFGPGTISMVLNVNGILQSIEMEPRTTLAEALRTSLKLTGTKVACNHGACSACTVWLDDLPVAACGILAIEVVSRKITTIEGLGDADHLHPVQKSFIEHDAIQCGFCTPGMVMSCAALLARNPHLGVEEVETAISGHLCRCGTYPHVVQAMLSLSAEQEADHG
ncbi:MAG: (2Fe-2S)-binding protein [Betaproteobacteria bacterium]|nr:(2Fe-2S)-binding protein [Betaproteobacteria bacterium]